MKAIITGGAGFIGSHLARHLLSLGWEVVVVDDLSTGRQENVPAEVEFVEKDVLHLSTLNGDVVFHLAAEATVKCRACWERNVLTTKRVAELAAREDVPVIYASSAAVYGGCRLCKEDQAPNPQNFYGATKLIGEAILKGMGIRHVSLRFFNVYGEGMNPAYGAVVLAFITSMLKGRPPTIFGDGLAVRDYIYVGDVVKALTTAAYRVEEITGKVINVGTGVATTVLELYTLLKDITSYKGEPVFAPPREGDVKESVASVERMKQLLLPSTTPLTEGLRRTVTYYKTFHSFP